MSTATVTQTWHAVTVDVTVSRGLKGEDGMPTNGTNGQALTSDGSGGFGTPVTLGTAATSNTSDFASAAQGATADSATKPGDDLTTLGSGAATDGFVATADGAGGVVWEASAVVSGTVDVVSNVATSTILGRTTAGSGDSEELTASQVRTLINVEDGADVTTTANVTAAGALMDSEVTNLAAVKSFDPTDYAASLGADDNYVTDAEKVVIGNTSGANTGDQTITLTGDVTGSGSGSFAATIANDAVTFARMQNIATEKLIGRHSSGSGDPEQVGIDGGLEFFGANIRRSALTGDVTASAGSNSTTLSNTAVTPGSYTLASITVDAKGRITAASTGSTSSTWDYLVTNWSTEPTLNAAITGGEVYDYTLSGVTRFRFVPTTYDPTQDAFWGSFDGTTLTDLITTRG